MLHFLLMCAGLAIMIWIGSFVLHLIFFVGALVISLVWSFFEWVGAKLNGR
jgi:hypothetical protein